MEEQEMKERIAVVETKMFSFDKIVNDLCCDIKEIKEQLLGRPSWLIVSVISLLTTICGSLAVFILNNL